MGERHFHYAESVKTLQGESVFDLWRIGYIGKMQRPHVTELLKRNKKIILAEHICIPNSLDYFFVCFSSIFLKQRKHAATMNITIHANGYNFVIAFSLSAFLLKGEILPSYAPFPCASHLPVTATQFSSLAFFGITTHLANWW